MDFISRLRILWALSGTLATTTGLPRLTTLWAIVQWQVLNPGSQLKLHGEKGCIGVKLEWEQISDA